MASTGPGTGVLTRDWTYRGGAPMPGLSGVTPESQLMLNGGVEDAPRPQSQPDTPDRPIAPIPPSLASLASTASGSGASSGGGGSAAPAPMAAAGAPAPAAGVPMPMPAAAQPQAAAAPSSAMAGLSVAANLPRDPSEGFVSQGSSPLNPRLGTRVLPQSVRALSQLSKVY